MPTLLARASDPKDKRCFEFSSLAEFREKAWYDAWLDLEFVEGTAIERDLFELAALATPVLDHYFAVLELDEQSQAQIAALMYCERPIEVALAQYNHVDVEVADDLDRWVYKWVDKQGGPIALGEDILFEFFDYSRFARVLAARRDVIELEFGGRKNFIVSHTI